MGFISNHVNGGVTINNNTMGDPDAFEIGLNTIQGGLACSGNLRDPNSHILPDDDSGGVPTNSFDGSPPNSNTVIGQETGQCAGLSSDETIKKSGGGAEGRLPAPLCNSPRPTATAGSACPGPSPTAHP
jgi:hypothetical protein